MTTEEWQNLMTNNPKNAVLVVIADILIKQNKPVTIDNMWNIIHSIDQKAVDMILEFFN